MMDSNNSYEGQFDRGQKTGFGTYSWAEGDKYEGGWSNGAMHGSGSLK